MPVGPTSTGSRDNLGLGEAQDESVVRSPWSVSMAYGQFQATLRFDQELELEVAQRMVSARLGYAFEGGWGLAVAFGAIVEGSLRGAERRLSFQPGFVTTLQASVMLMQAEGALPFIESTLNLSASTGTLREFGGPSRQWTAVDIRLGVTTGWRVARIWVPYVAMRVFGGPVFWRDDEVTRIGTDSHHFQVAIGSSLSLFGLDLFVDWGLPIGETSVAAGLGAQF